MGDVQIANDLRERGIRDERVLEAMASLTRAEFMPEAQRARSQFDGPLPIGHGQTISQPYIVAFMTEALHITPGTKVLEVGTGSGYQAAVLARMGATVLSVERIPELAASARTLFARWKLPVLTRIGDGGQGWPEFAPFERIIVTAAAAETPPRLVEQLANGGRMIAPIGADPDHQTLILIERSAEGQLSWRDLLSVRFVPLIEDSNAQLS